jgi:hypothetical protein
MESRHAHCSFAAGYQALRRLESRGVDEHDVLLFGRWVEEVARHLAAFNCLRDSCSRCVAIISSFI